MSSEQMRPAISARGLTKVFDIYGKPHLRMLDALMRNKRRGATFIAVENVSFEVMPGETLGIIGRNGAGKSTLLQLITGVLKPSAGHVTVDGRVAALLELGAGFNPDFTGRENARFNAALLGLKRREVDERLESIIDFSELGEFIDQPIKTYSSGMYVRLAFSVAVHVDAAVLIVDEALSVGDARFQAKCMDKIGQIKAKGTTILFVSHDVMAVRQLCEKAIWLERGRLMMQGDVVQVTSAYMKSLFDGENAGSEADSDCNEEMNREILTGWDGIPLSHWGKSMGAIVHVDLRSRAGLTQRLFQNGEEGRVLIRWKMLPSIPLDSIGVSFSIKDINGADLIVGSSWEMGIRWEENSGNRIMQAEFNLPLALAPGDYMLVAAIEDRGVSGIEYHEYIEGACYFSTAYDRRVHGSFVPAITCKITRSEV